MSLKLYIFLTSTCSQKAQLTLWEKGIPFEAHVIDPKTREHLSDWYLNLNPNGVVPTLIHDEAVIIDSSVIMEYLDEVFPDVSLTPTDPVRRAHMRKWMRYFEEVPTSAIRVPSFNKYLSRRYANVTQEQYSEMIKHHPIRKQFYEKMKKEKGFDKRETANALDGLQQTIARIEKGLVDSGGPWLMGDTLTLADYCIAPIIDRMNDLGLSGFWQYSPQVSLWYASIKERPAFKKTFVNGTRLTDVFESK